MNLKENLTLYCVYHDKKLETENTNARPWVQDYYRPLVENKWFKPYYTKEGHINSLDNLQQFFCEFTALYYIYKNNLYSPYIGLCHYGRQYLRTYVDNLSQEENENYNINIVSICRYTNNLRFIFNDCPFGGYLYDDLKEYILANYKNDSMFYKLFIDEFDTEQPWIANMNFITTWNIFYPIMEFMCNFVDYYNDKYNLNYDPSKYKEHIETIYIDVVDWSKIDSNGPFWWLYPNRYRVFAYFCEYVFGFCLARVENNLTE